MKEEWQEKNKFQSEVWVKFKKERIKYEVVAL